MGLHYDEQRLEGRDEFKDSSGSNSRPLIILRNVCELCGHSFDNQYMFYKHLKEHYEPEFVQIGYQDQVPAPIPEDEIESEYGKDDENSGFVNDNEQFEEIFANNINKSPDMIEHLEIFIKNQESRAESYQTNDDRFGVIDGDGMMMIEDPGTVAEIEENVRAEAENIQRNGNSQSTQVNDLPMELSQQVNTSLHYQQQHLKMEPVELLQLKRQQEEHPERHFTVIPPESPASPIESQQQQQPADIPPRPATPLDSPQSPTETEKDISVIVKITPTPKQKAKVTYPCHKCERSFDTTTALKYHLTAHESRTIKCGHCDKMFLTKSTLKVHMRIHLEERPYGCPGPQCELRFRQKNDLNYHVASKHTAMQDYQFKCEFCDKKFARKYSLNLHTKLHTGTKDHCCEICSKAFRASSYLQVHLRTHSGERPYECSECLKKFSVKADLRRHTKKMHKEKETAAVVVIEDETKSKEDKPAASTSLSSIIKKQLSL